MAKQMTVTITMTVADDANVGEIRDTTEGLLGILTLGGVIIDDVTAQQETARKRRFS